MTFIGTSAVTILSLVAALIMIFGAGAYLAGAFFGMIFIGGLIAMYKLATEIDKHIP